MKSTSEPLRKIRSFVRREGRMTPGQQRALASHWLTYGLSLDDGTLNFTQLFTQSGSCILEIGFGMGENLLNQAAMHRDYNFIGIEVHRPGVGKLLAAAAEQQLTNLKVFCADALDVLQHCIADASLDGVLLFFPDPWHKKRHHKRRIVQTDFVHLIATKLQAGGIFHIATDWQGYAEHIHDILAQSTDFTICDNNPLLTRSHTRFEQRGLRLGHQLYDFVLQRIK